MLYSLVCAHVSAVYTVDKVITYSREGLGPHWLRTQLGQNAAGHQGVLAGGWEPSGMNTVDEEG